MSSFDDFPPGSILSEMRVDLLASTRTGEVSLFYEGIFYRTLSWLEYNPQTAELVFVFDEKLRVPLGTPLTADLARHVAKAKQIAAFQVTTEGEPGTAQMIALRVKGH